MLLSQADTAWTSMRGVYRQWRRQALVDVAFHRWRHSLSAAGVTSLTTTVGRREENSEPDPIIESVLAVAADGCGQRRRADALRRNGEEWLPDTVVIDGATFWARTGATVMTNDGDPRHGHGGADFAALLQPSRVPAGFDLAAVGELDEVAGRHCVVVSASPRRPDPYGRIPGAEVFHMIAGLGDFRLCVDLRTGILLRVTKMVDGEVAEVCEFTEITIDEPLDDSLFAPLR